MYDTINLTQREHINYDIICTYTYIYILTVVGSTEEDSAKAAILA